jgi:predicted phosphoribosyltransferase
MPVGYEVASALDAPLEPFLVRKLGVPGHEELAMGAIASGGVRVLSDDVVRWYDIRPETIENVARREQAELDRREQAYRGGRDPQPIEGRIAILVDDGLATGASMRAAVKAVRVARPAKVIVAGPVGAAETCREMTSIADEVVCAYTPARFSAVGEWYLDFSQTTDEEVRLLLSENAARRSLR